MPTKLKNQHYSKGSPKIGKESSERRCPTKGKRKVKIFDHETRSTFG
jgi:hypothetical protein